MKRSDSRRLKNVLRWAQESNEDPSMATADWLAQDIDPTVPSAISLLTDRSVSLDHVIQAKDVFKTMRLIGETAADRRMGGRLYLAAIAAALVFHRTRISRQSTTAISRGLTSMMQDGDVPPVLRELAAEAVESIAGRDTRNTEPRMMNPPAQERSPATYRTDSQHPPGE